MPRGKIVLYKSGLLKPFEIPAGLLKIVEIRELFFEHTRLWEKEDG